MAVTFQHTAAGRYLISREFESLAAAARGASALESVCEKAFQPVPIQAPDLETTPKLQAQLDRADEDAPTESLTAGTAHDPAGYAKAAAAQRETGE